VSALLDIAIIHSKLTIIAVCRVLG